jgi:integrase/recombinase XerD
MNNSDYQKNYGFHLKTIGYSNDYLRRIRMYLRFLDMAGINCMDSKQIDYDLFMDYILYLKETRNKCNSGINNHIKAIKHFYRYASMQNYIDSKVLTEIKKLSCFSVPVTKKSYFTKEEVEELLECANGFYNFSDKFNPDKADLIVWFMFYTGVRRQELLNLKRQDFDLKKCEALIKIPNKTSRERLVLFPKKIAKMLEHYFNSEIEITNAFNVSANILIRFFSIINDFVPGIKGKNYHFTPHALRHSFAMMLVNSGVDVAIAQKLLGHASVQNTLIYYNPNEKNVKDIYNQKVF